jgi:transposase-like protein
VKVNGLEYWVYAAIDVDRNEVLSMRVFPSRNVLVTKLFIEEVLRYCDGRLPRCKQRSVADRCPQGAGPKMQRRALSEIEA